MTDPHDIHATAGGGGRGATAASDGQRIVSARNLSHVFERGNVRHAVLDGISLSLAAGESVAVIGRSGSGKSTLLNLIAGLEPVQHGQLELFDQPLSGLSDHRRTLLRRHRIGFIYQSFNLIPTLSVDDNIGLPLALTGMSANVRQPRLVRMLEATGLSGRGDDYPDRLSGGEQQRVAIARALIHAPDLILADEPTGNLDAETGRAVLAMLNNLVSEQRAAMLLVTHSLEVARIADRTFRMQGGQLVSVDTSSLATSSAW